MNRLKLLVVGNGMAGIRCIEEILKLEPERFDITVIGSEPHPNYNRILLSKVLQGDRSLEDIILNDWSWYEKHRIRLLSGETVHAIDIRQKHAKTLSGHRISYDSLILATGSLPFIPPIAGTDKEGVISFRTIEDCERMTEMAKRYAKAAVIGGGLLGLEAARGLLHLGMETEVVHNAPYIMNRQLDRQSARLLQRELEEQGMRFHLSKETTKLTGRSRVQGLRFSDGTRLEADLVVLAVGIRPNVDLAKSSGIRTNRAIIVDDFMQTSEPDVYAVGECAEHRGISYGLVAPLYEQGKVLARVLCGKTASPYEGSIPYSQLKVSGVDVFSAGDIAGEHCETAILHYDSLRRTYKKITMREGKVAGAILYGDMADSSAMLGLVKRGADASELVRKQESGSGANPAENAAKALAGEETVCACNGVTKRTIVEAVKLGGLGTADEIRDKTGASGSCGGCRPMVEALVKLASSGGADADIRSPESRQPIPVCGCTPLDQESLRKAVRAATNTGSASFPGLLAELGWGTAGGCEICRPAVSYYLDAIGSASPDRRGIMPDSGRTNALGLGTAASTAGVTVYVSGQGARSGGDNPLLDAVYRIGDRLANEWGGISLPGPVRAGVAESTEASVSVLVQGIGIAASPAGWEVYLGGNASHPVREGELIGLVESGEEAVRLASACLQWYRMNGLFGEAVWEWVERTEIAKIREIVFDARLQEELGNQLRSAASRGIAAGIS